MFKLPRSKGLTIVSIVIASLILIFYITIAFFIESRPVFSPDISKMGNPLMSLVSLALLLLMIFMAFIGGLEHHFPAFTISLVIAMIHGALYALRTDPTVASSKIALMFFIALLSNSIVAGLGVLFGKKIQYHP